MSDGFRSGREIEVVSERDRRGRPLRTVIDMNTGLVRNDPIPGDAELEKFYAEDYRREYKSAEKPRRRQIVRNFRRVAAHVRAFRDVIGGAQSVLDVGAGSGEFVFLARELGKDVRGIEPNRGYAEYCRDDLGLDVAAAHLAPDLFEPGQFDLIHYSDTETLLRAVDDRAISDIGVPADFVIVGSVTEFGRETIGDTGAFSRTKTQKAHARVNLRLVDVRSSRVIFAAEGAGSAESEVGTTFGVGTTAAYDSTLNDKATR